MSKITKLVHQRLTQLAVREPAYDEAIKLFRLRLTVPKVRLAMQPNYSFISDSSEKI